MHRYEELERVYYKRIILKYTVFIVLIILFVVGFFILKKTMNSKKEIKHKIIAKQVQKKERKIIKTTKVKTIKVKITKKEKSNEVNKSFKSYHFLLPNISRISVSKKSLKQDNKKIKNNTKTAVKKDNNVSKKIKEIQINHTANLDKIKITETIPNLKTLINKFNITKDFDLAILISKIYFKKNDLADAQIWALKANNINPASYKSWILFADILLKKKKPKKAKEILKVYIDSYGRNDIIEEKLRSLND